MLINAYAKINLGLNVLYKRRDGFHEIETIFQQISLHDTLTIERRPDSEIHLSSDVAWCPVDKRNLVHKTALMLQEKSGVSAGCNVHLQKRIPAGGGLGGGSSNAAAALKALNTLWNINADDAALFDMAAELGSDVPFFLRGGMAVGRGRGEILIPVQAEPSYTGILVRPNVSVSTAWAYQKLKNRLTTPGEIVIFSDFFEISREPNTWRNKLKNDLESPVFEHYPELADIHQQLYDAGAFYARMSGSGSCLFGLFQDHHTTKHAKHRFNHWRCELFSPMYST